MVKQVLKLIFGFTLIFLPGLVFGQHLESVKSEYEKVEQIADSLYAVYSGDRCALYNAKQQRMITDFKFSNLGTFFSTGYAEFGIKINDKRWHSGLINASGQVITGDHNYFGFEAVWVSTRNREISFTDELEVINKDKEQSKLYLKFEDSDKPWKEPRVGLIGPNGNVVIPPVYDDIWNENYGLVCIYALGKFGIYDVLSDKVLIPAELDETHYEKTLDRELLRYNESKKTAETTIDTLYFRNGIIKKIRSWKAGKLNGTTFEYDQYGQLIKEICYQDGEVTQSKNENAVNIVFPDADFNAQDIAISQNEEFLLTLPDESGKYFYLIQQRTGKVIRKIPLKDEELKGLSSFYVNLGDSALYISQGANVYSSVNLSTGEVSAFEIAELPVYYEEQDAQFLRNTSFSEDWLSCIVYYQGENKSAQLDIFARNVISGHTVEIRAINIGKQDKLIKGLKDNLLAIKYFPDQNIVLCTDFYDILQVFELNKNKVKLKYEKQLNGDMAEGVPTSSIYLVPKGVVIEENDDKDNERVSSILFYDFSRKEEQFIVSLENVHPFHFNAVRCFFDSKRDQMAIYTYSDQSLIQLDIQNKQVKECLIEREGEFQTAYSFKTQQLFTLSDQGEMDIYNVENNSVKPGVGMGNLTSVVFNQFYEEDKTLVFHSTKSDSARTVLDMYYLNLGSGQFEKSQFPDDRFPFQLYVNDSLFYSELAFSGSRKVYLINRWENKLIYDHTKDNVFHELSFYNRDLEQFTERHVHLSVLDNGAHILYTPDGYYMGSKDLNGLIYFEKELDLYPFEQFDLKFNRPDIVLKRLGYSDSTMINAYHQAYQKRLKKMGFTEDMLEDDFQLPKIEIENFEEMPTLLDEGSIQLKLKMKDEKYKLDRINVWVNDVAIYGVNGITLKDKEVREYTTDLEVFLAKGMNKVQVSVLNQVGAESYKVSFNVECSAGKEQSDLYLITIGESEFRQSDFNLTYASKDAQDMAALLSESPVYGRVHIKTLINEEVTRENVIALKAFLQSADINDEVMIFIAGHGVLDAQLDYYFATHDMDFMNPAQRGLAYEDLEQLLDGIKPLKKILLIDACHSGEIDKEEVELVSAEVEEDQNIQFRMVGHTTQPKLGIQKTSELTKSLFTDLRRGTGATVISSAGGMEFAMEGDGWNNGLFTYCIIDGIKSKAADLNKDGEIWLSEVQQYVADQVYELSNGRQQPTSRIENQSVDFRIW